FAQVSQRDWEPIGAAGESGYAAGDPLHPGVIYGGEGSRWDLETNLSVPNTTAPKGSEPDRANWTQPLVLSVADPHALYYASQFLFKTTDGARTWKQMSGDLTRPDPGIAPYIYRTRNQGRDWQPITTGLPDGVYVHVVKEDPLRRGLLFAGTERGAFVSFDDGDHWQLLQRNLPVTSVRDFVVYGTDLI